MIDDFAHLLNRSPHLLAGRPARGPVADTALCSDRRACRGEGGTISERVERIERRPEISG